MLPPLITNFISKSICIYNSINFRNSVLACEHFVVPEDQSGGLVNKSFLVRD